MIDNDLITITVTMITVTEMENDKVKSLWDISEF